MNKRTAKAHPRPSAREQALVALLRIEQDRAFVGFQSSAVIGTDPRLQRQVREYVAGVTRLRRRLDFLIDHFYKGKAHKLEQVLRQILRLGIYELLYQATPAHAAINEAVRLAKQRVRTQAGGLVNGVLRAVQRQQNELPMPTASDLSERWAIQHSHPTWLVERWLVQFGEDATERLLIWNNTRPAYSVRPNLLQTTAHEFRMELREQAIPFDDSIHLDTFVRLRALQGLMQTGWLASGRCSVQDEAAGLVVQLVDPQPHETILDGCAAPGGKAFFVAERMGNTGVLHVWDAHAGRLQRLVKGGESRGYRVLQPRVVDLTDVNATSSNLQADRVLIDAPCTGTGVLAKRADLRWNRTAQDLTALCTLQRRILTNAATFVKPGGVLVYSTCSIEPEENEEQIETFLKHHPEYLLEPAVQWLDVDLVTDSGFYASLPHVHGMDGAFAARLRRRS